MCAIFGFMDTRSKNINILQKMSKTLLHRGPDNQKFFIDKNIYMGFNRLSIVDLSNNSMQPMINDDKNIILTMNGEIYNYIELKDELIKKGYNFKSNGDAEVLLYYYIEYGLDKTLQKINGMYSIAIYDKRDGSFYLIRDRMGKKPLYYQCVKDSLIYASELKGIKSHPDFISEINEDPIYYYLLLEGIPAPYTIYKHTNKLEAGSYVKYKDGKITKKKYWDLSFKEKILINEDEAFCSFNNILNDSFLVRQRIDVKKALFLSGGLDSTLIAKLFFDNKTNIKAITSIVDNQNINEEQYAKIVANRYKLDFETTKIQLPIDDINTYISKLDEPFADSAILPTFAMSKNIHNAGYKVVFTGDGGDELMNGYSTKQEYFKLFNVFYKFNFLQKNYTQLKLINPKYRVLGGFFSEKMPLIENFSFDKIFELMEPIFNSLRIRSNNYIEFKQLFDIWYLQNFYNYKVDIATMAYSIESRAPLQDYRLFEFISTLPNGYYSDKNNLGKKFTKKILLEDFNKGFIFRKKQGFNIGIGDFINKIDSKREIKLSKDLLNIRIDNQLIKDKFKYQLYILGRFFK